MDFLQEPAPFNSDEEALAFLDATVGKGEVSNIAYLGLAAPGSHTKVPTIVSTYKGEWVERYIDEEYVNVDPAIVEGLKGILPYDWRGNGQRSKGLQNFFGEASEFGIFPNGLSIPIRGSYGERAVLSINSALPDDEWDHFKDLYLGQLTVFAYQFHLSVFDLHNDVPAPKQASLSPREKDIIYWAAAGKTAWETSMILGISEKSVDFYLSNIKSKLRVTNKPHMVAKAIRLGLIH